MAATILLVEDDPNLAETLAYALELRGYTVLRAEEGWAALRLAQEAQPHLVLLDWMLPGLDGLEVCRRLRQRGFQAPILMLTARDAEVDRVRGLEEGADDYITKPFSMRELMARIHAHLRRAQRTAAEQSPADAQRLVFDDLVIDVPRHQVTLAGRPLALKPKEFDLLLFLARHPGRVLSRALILERVWGWEFHGGSRTVDVHIRWLREKIEPDPAHPRRIVTVRGVGYRFEG